jgi:hypothetical protein
MLLLLAGEFWRRRSSNADGRIDDELTRLGTLEFDSAIRWLSTSALQSVFNTRTAAAGIGGGHI